MNKKALWMVVLLTMIGASGAFAQIKWIDKKGDFVKNANVHLVPYIITDELGWVDVTNFTVTAEGSAKWNQKTYETHMKNDGKCMVWDGWTIKGKFKLDIDYGGGSSAIVYSFGGTIKVKKYKDNNGVVNLELVDAGGTILSRVSIDNSGRSSLLLSFISCVQTDKIERDVNSLKKPGQSKDQLADAVIAKKSGKGGFLGAIAGIGSTIAAPVAVVGELNKMCVNAEMAYAVAYAYGYQPSGMEFENDLAMLLGDDSAVKTALKEAAGITPKELTKAAIGKLTESKREELKNKLIVVITKKLGSSLTKGALGTIKVTQTAVDVAGSFSDAKKFGEKAKKYYKG